MFELGKSLKLPEIQFHRIFFCLDFLKFSGLLWAVLNCFLSISTYIFLAVFFLASCQKNAWLTYHREECMYLKKVAPKIPPDTVRLMARIILKLRNGGAKECDVLPDGQQRYFDDLLTHQKEIVRDSSRIEAFQNFYLVLKDCLDKFLPPKSEVLDIYGRILINSFNLMNDKFQSVGVG